jgi:hypothetical protein
MNDRGVESVCERYNVHNLKKELSDLGRTRSLRLPMPTDDEPGKITARDVLVFKTWRIGAEKSVLKTDDAWVMTMSHHTVKHLGFVL